MTATTALLIAIAVIEGLIGVIFWLHVKDNDMVRDRLEAHIKTCDETPNKAILESIVALAARLSTMHSENKDSIGWMRDDMNHLREEVAEQCGDIKVLKDRAESRRSTDFRQRRED